MRDGAFSFERVVFVPDELPHNEEELISRIDFRCVEFDVVCGCICLCLF